MKPAEKKSEEVYRIINRSTGEAVGSYSRAYRDEYDFGSVKSARAANCHGVLKMRRRMQFQSIKSHMN